MTLGALENQDHGIHAQPLTEPFDFYQQHQALLGVVHSYHEPAWT
jgi:hypothetical protein